MGIQDTRLHADLPKRINVRRSGDPFLSSSWLPRGVALEHCEIDNVAGLSLEFERVDNGESPKRQRIGLDCEIGGERDQNEEAPVDGNGSVVETFAQDWSPLDRQMQRECADSRQRTRALLGWSRGQNGHSQI